MSDVLLEEVGPNGNIQAVVESDDQACFFYLYGAPETDFGMKSVWVRNHTPAPDSLDVRRMQAGSPPANPRAHCRHSQGLPWPRQEQLRVVWLPEGDGAALYEGEAILAIIPPWSGVNGFHGYASESVGEGPLAWELRSDNVLRQRFDDAQAYWRQWDDETLWPTMQSQLLSQVETALGRHSNYYAIDGGYWPPKALVRIPREESVVLVTIGVSVRPQPCVEMYTDNPKPLRRIELGAVLPKHWPEEAIKQFAGYLSGQSNLPWTQYTWLGPAHTLPCDSWRNDAFDYAILSPEHPNTAQVTLGPIFDDPVHVLWFLPITAAERQTAIDHGGEQLVNRLPPRRWEEA